MRMPGSRADQTEADDSRDVKTSSIRDMESNVPKMRE